jgi:two-component system response regulator HydG
MHVGDLDLRDLFQMRVKGGVHQFLEERALLINADAFGWSRRSLLEKLGADEARGLVSRIGYVWGWQAADATRELPWDSPDAWRQAGTRLPALQGLATLKDPDDSLGQLPASLTWRSSLEADQHLLREEKSEAPVCWLLAGYLSGFFSRTSDAHIICEEDSCRARGDLHCRTVLRQADSATTDLAPPGAAIEAFFAGRASTKTAKTLEAVLGDADDTRTLGVASPAMQRLLHSARLAAQSTSTVLITGESGVGKEYLARFIHRESPRASGPFIPLNCGAVTDTLLESELFGHGRGAFTGAAHERAGLFEAAHGGTIFLDEIGEMPLTMQVKLLRVLQEKEIRRVGENRSRTVDVRVIVATNRDPAVEVSEGRFRKDLYYRVSVVAFHVPALRDRPDDLRMLTRSLLTRQTQQMKRNITGFTPRALECVLRYPWPGNVRELQNAIERACVLAAGPLIDVGDLPPSLRGTHLLRVAPVEVRPLREIEREYILAALQRNQGNKARTASQLRIANATLFRKLKGYKGTVASEATHSE